MRARMVELVVVVAILGVISAIMVHDFAALIHGLSTQ